MPFFFLEFSAVGVRMMNDRREPGSHLTSGIMRVAVDASSPEEAIIRLGARLSDVHYRPLVVDEKQAVPTILQRVIAERDSEASRLARQWLIAFGLFTEDRHKSLTGLCEGMLSKAHEPRDL